MHSNFWRRIEIHLEPSKRRSTFYATSSGIKEKKSGTPCPARFPAHSPSSRGRGRQAWVDDSRLPVDPGVSIRSQLVVGIINDVEPLTINRQPRGTIQSSPEGPRAVQKREKILSITDCIGDNYCNRIAATFCSFPSRRRSLKYRQLREFHRERRYVHFFFSFFKVPLN